jgi:acetylornithine deacetylase/succinyl-diaminopimelate desuccinylase-like protein
VIALVTETTGHRALVAAQPAPSVAVTSRGADAHADEAMRHFQAILRLDTQNPPGNEVRVVEYLKDVLQREGIETATYALDPQRPNLVARLRGDGSKRPLLVMGHTDVVTVDVAKWTHAPFSATRAGGHVYGRGSLDDKPSVVAGLMTMLRLKRANLPLARDVIFLAEAGEEGNLPFGINHMVSQHWEAIDAEYCLAEGGSVPRSDGVARYAAVTTTEKIPHTIRLAARGVAGHGSVPLETNPIVHLSAAIARLATWRAPIRLNETTRAQFLGLAALAAPEEAARYRALVEGRDVEAIRDHLSAQAPQLHALLRTTISPNIVKGGYLRNVIPSEAEATLDVRALPDEDMDAFLANLRRVVDDPAVEIGPMPGMRIRPPAPPSRLDSEAFEVIAAVHEREYGVPVLPTMMTGATDMAQVRARGVQCYGIGPMIDREDAPRGYGAHGDQERILEAGFHAFLRVHFDIVRELAGRR